VLVNVSQDAGHFLRPVKTREGCVGSGSDSKPGSNFAFCKPACQWCESESGFRMEIPAKRPLSPAELPDCPIRITEVWWREL